MNELTIKEFDYSQLDRDTQDFIKEKENTIIQISNKTRTELGKEYYEVQQRLAKDGYGCFLEWVESIGAKTSSVYRLIAYYENLVLPNWERQTLIESMPKTLQHELSKPSTDKELVQEVLDKEITSMSEYQQLVKEKKQVQDKLEQETLENVQLRAELQKVKSEQPKEVIKEIVKEVIPSDYSDLKETVQRQNATIQSLRQKEKEALSKLNEQQANKKISNDAFNFSFDVDEFIKKVGGLIYLTDHIHELKGQDKMYFERSIQRIYDWANQLYFNYEETRKK